MHLQRQGDEQAGSGSGGASSLKKRLYCSSSVDAHAPSHPTTLTACHGCLKRRGSFVLVHHLRKLVCHSLVPPQITVGLIRLGKFPHHCFGIVHAAWRSSRALCGTPPFCALHS